MMDTGKSGGLNNEGLQILVTNRSVEFGHKVYTENLFPRLMKEMDVTDWKLTLYPNEEEDEITRLRRDEMEVNIAQRMMQIGFQPELVEESGRDLRFIYKKAPPPPPGQPGQGGMPPGQGGMPPGMGGGGAGMQGPMAQPGGLPTRNIPPQLAGALAGQAGAGRRAMGSPSGGEGMGLRDNGPVSPQNMSSMGAGAPFSSVQQRGPQPGPLEQASRNVTGL